MLDGLSVVLRLPLTSVCEKTLVIAFIAWVPILKKSDISDSHEVNFGFFTA
jgi:hypothetical protein